MSQWLKLVGRNALRHRLRTVLTLAGLVVAILSFGVLQTIVDAWYANVNSAVPSRLITRNALSFTLPLPVTYARRIGAVDGVRRVSYMSWFGGIYKEPKNFFPQFAIEAKSYLDVHPEIVLPDAARRAFLADRRGAIVGRKLADRYGFQPGDVIQLGGTIFPGQWDFVVDGIFEGRGNADTSQLYFHWDYLNETLRKRSPSQADQVGFYVIDVGDLNSVVAVSQAIDRMFVNSLAETLTETERGFQIGFVKRTEAILVSIRAVAFVIVVIILAVLSNTMAMTARERMPEYATLKALGFSPGYVARLILGESLLIALLGGAIGVALTAPVAALLGSMTETLFPSLIVSGGTVAAQALAALAVGVFAALLPMRQAARVRIVDGLRAVG